METKQILVTGFGRFLDVVENPSGAIARAADGFSFGGVGSDEAGSDGSRRDGSGRDAVRVSVRGVELPVAWREAKRQMIELVERLHPDGVLMFGVCRDPFFRVEVLAKNAGGHKPDAVGEVVTDAARDPLLRLDGDEAAVALRTTLPVAEMMAHVGRMQARARASEPYAALCDVRLSSDAGDYLCNALFFHTVAHMLRTGRAHVPTGFVHVPPLDESARPGEPMRTGLMFVEAFARVLAGDVMPDAGA